MRDYVIITDSSCDLPKEKVASWGIECIEMKYRFDLEDFDRGNYELTAKEFYDMIRSGKSSKTFAINSEEFKDVFIPFVDKGKDVIYLSFSSGLSSTYNFSVAACEELSEQFPERKIISVDTLCESAGLGLLAYLVKEKADAGATIEEIAEYVKETGPKVAHWVTVDDLMHLKRGGRISSTVAIAGTVLGIKPIIHVDDEGKLVNVDKVRGRKASFEYLAKKVAETSIDPKNTPVFLSHGDCYDDAMQVVKLLEEKYGIKVESVSEIGPVIGSHSGPGTIAVFFLSEDR